MKKKKQLKQLKKNIKEATERVVARVEKDNYCPVTKINEALCKCPRCC